MPKLKRTFGRCLRSREVLHLHLWETGVCGIGPQFPGSNFFKKLLHQTPTKLQRMSTRTQMYSIDLGYNRGSAMYFADTLSIILPYDGSQEVVSEVESINMTQRILQETSTLLET